MKKHTKKNNANENKIQEYLRVYRDPKSRAFEKAYARGYLSRAAEFNFFKDKQKRKK